MLRCFGYSLLGLLALASSQGFLALLQVFAWGSMVFDNAREVPLDDALARTFSGDYACEVCVYVAREHSKESTASLIQTTFKNLLPLTAIATTEAHKCPTKASSCYPSFPEIPPSWITSPDDPPPRGVTALSA